MSMAARWGFGVVGERDRQGQLLKKAKDRYGALTPVIAAPAGT